MNFDRKDGGAMVLHPEDYQMKIPYPAVKTAGPNIAYARMMLRNIGSRNSETSSCMLYLYDRAVTTAYPEISNVFEQIMHTEEIHLDLFSQAAFQLGADPRAWYVPGGRAQYWSPAALRYTTVLRPLLQNALALERATIAEYELQIQKTQDEGLLQLLRRVLLDESMHVEIFRSLIASYNA
ncbi:MAG: rubrerythrin family protein [Oscillospiraceae bacterium]|nr:rubrerythrin family protein [Oscillospiraceae bacterium]